MHHFVWVSSLILASSLITAELSGAVRGDQVMYVGGSLTSIPERTEGRLDTSDQITAIFVAKNGKFEIPYKQITTLEYGQKAGRRIGVAIAVSPVALLSKKRKHYLTVSFVDEKGGKQGVVLEVGKSKVRSVATTLEVKSGKKVEFESDEARKHFGGK